MWELREGLKERGESWHKWPDEDSTTWQAYSNPHTATESMDGTLIVTGLTPAQAIAATLGVVEYRKPTTLSKLEAENAELREFCVRLNTFAFNCYHGVFDQEVFFRLREKYHELGIEEDT